MNRKQIASFNRCAQSAGPFGVISAPLEPFLEHFGHIVCVQKQIGASKAVQGAPKAATPEIRSPFWTFFGIFSVMFLHFLIKQVGPETCHVFPLIWGSPWANGTRLRSRNTFFRFYIFF